MSDPQPTDPVAGAGGRLHPVVETDPRALLALFDRHRHVHVYGLADVAQLWDTSTWYRDADAAVGILDLPGGGAPVLYAVSPAAPARTLDLLAALADDLPDHFVITGPVGLTDRLAGAFTADWHDRYLKMGLLDTAALPPTAGDVVVLGRDDLPALSELFATDPDAGDFFHVGLLDTDAYVGRWLDGRLVACAGVHVLDRQVAVAAIGNVATHPEHRRRGHGRAVVATLCHRLLHRAPTVGLNVRDRTPEARRLYERLGFRALAPYEEAELRRAPHG